MIYLAILAALTASPATFSATLIKAKAGDTVTLAKGEYGAVQLPRGDYSPAIEVDARAATFTSVIVRSTVGNQCINFHLVPDIFDAAGKLGKGRNHPDCIQSWSRLAYPPTSDILIEGNTSYGVAQGIFFGDAGQGGYDRIMIRNNDLTLGYFHGIAIYEGRGAVIQNNRIMPIPGARLLGGNRGPVWPWVVTLGSSDANACGNVVGAEASRYGTERCR